MTLELFSACVPSVGSTNVSMPSVSATFTARPTPALASLVKILSNLGAGVHRKSGSRLS
jgi:hypothetical protein